MKKLKKKPKVGQEQGTIPGHLSSSRTQAASHTDSDILIANASQDQTPLQKSSVYTSIEELTMDRFIACACENDMSKLIKEGNPLPEELYNAWMAIKSQHLENIKDPQANYYIEMLQEITEFDWRKQEVDTLLFLLSQRISPEVVKMLQSTYGYDYDFSPETCRDDIDKVRAELGSEEIQLRTYRQLLIEAENEAQTPVKGMYYTTIAALQKHFGLCAGKSPMNAAKELTVYEFGHYVKEYNAYQRSQSDKIDIEDVSTGY